VIFLPFASLVATPAGAQRIVAETFMIAAVDPGIQLHVASKRLEGATAFRPSGCSDVEFCVTSRVRGHPDGNTLSLIEAAT
jgi:hypothetical protein